jgi:predicted acetyltransferase
MTGMSIDVRTITDDEVAAWSAAVNTGFLNPTGDIDAEARRPGLFLDRTWAGFDADRVVATLRSFPTELTVPGGAAVPVGAVTAVTTTSTHRRRGLATRLVTADLAGSRERGELASILIAAEWQIYGRFGYGAATEHQSFTVDAATGRLRVPPQGTVEYVDRDTARVHVPALIEQQRAVRPGDFAQTDRFIDITMGILWYPSWKEPKPAFHVLARDQSGEVVGYAQYEVEDAPGRVPNGVAAVRLFLAADPQGQALLWQHLLSLDLVSTVQLHNRPVDELLPWLMVDARHARPADRCDFLWLRPLDVAGLLAARRYPVPGRFVVEVRDPLGLTGGRFELAGGPDAARCEPTGAPADLTLDVGVLGSAYLGGYSLGVLAAAGLVAEDTPGAVAVADAMLRWPVAPWCSTWF